MEILNVHVSLHFDVVFLRVRVSVVGGGGGDAANENNFLKQ